MRRRVSCLLTILCLFGFGPIVCADQILALVGGVLLDGRGGPPLSDSVVIIQNGRIQSVGRKGSLQIPAGATVLDTEGKTVLPGLTDVHAHLAYLGQNQEVGFPKIYADNLGDRIMPLAAKQLLAAGVTSARDPYIPLKEGLELRSRIRSGQIPGPRLWISGPALTGGIPPDTEKAFAWGVGDVADARAKVRRLAEAGVDFIKVLNTDRIAQDVMNGIVEEAHQRKLKVTSHSFSAEEIRRGLEAGVDSFEHLDQGSNPSYPPDVMARIRERNLSLHWVPTIGADYAYRDALLYPERLDDPRIGAFLPDDLWSHIRSAAANPLAFSWMDRNARYVPTIPEKFQQLRDSGVTLLVGSDAGTEFNFHPEATWREMWQWQNLGIPAHEILQAATRRPANFLRQKELGVVAPGMLADVIVVDGNPLESMRDLRNIWIVIQGGRLFVRDGKWIGPR